MEDKVNIKIIQNYIEENNFSKTKFCKMCNISPSTYAKIISGDGKYNVKALYRIARVLNISVDDFFMRNAFKDR